ncbi:DUF1127 domain-containing protein [Nioella aestuarii]|uniref:DUF1127 domain-containing protein n=1 Tax=Nioella aestuarii TaxID=1662864 RepID=UPI003D7FC365
MASIDMSLAAPASQGVFARIIARLVQASTEYSVALSRVDQVTRLNAMTDEELAQMQLRREDIPRYVFRDILYI